MDRGAVFTSNAYKQYCEEENIERVLITTGVPCANGQVECLNQSIIAILTKLSLPKPGEWYKHVDKVQQCINSAFNRSIGITPFNLLIGVNMRLKNDPQLREALQQAAIETFQQGRLESRSEAKKNIQTIQEESWRTYNRKKKLTNKYRVGDVMTIQCTQLGPDLKVHPKCLGPYKIITALRNDRYLVEKLGEQRRTGTSTSADLKTDLKLWPKQDWDLDIDVRMEGDDDDPYTPSIEGDADIRIAECGIASESALF